MRGETRSEMLRTLRYEDKPNTSGSNDMAPVMVIASIQAGTGRQAALAKR